MMTGRHLGAFSWIFTTHFLTIGLTYLAFCSSSTVTSTTNNNNDCFDCWLSYEGSCLEKCPFMTKEEENPSYNSSLCTNTTATTTTTIPITTPGYTTELSTTQEQMETSTYASSTSSDNKTEINQYQDYITRNSKYICVPIVEVWLCVGLAMTGLLLFVFIICVTIVCFVKKRRKTKWKKSQANKSLPSMDDIRRMETTLGHFHSNDKPISNAKTPDDEQPHSDHLDLTPDMQPTYVNIGNYGHYPEHPGSLKNQQDSYSKDVQPDPGDDPPDDSERSPSEPSDDEDSSFEYDYPEVPGEDFQKYVERQKEKHRQQAKKEPAHDPKGRLPELPDPAMDQAYAPMYEQRNKLRGVEFTPPIQHGSRHFQNCTSEPTSQDSDEDPPINIPATFHNYVNQTDEHHMHGGYENDGYFVDETGDRISRDYYNMGGVNAKRDERGYTGDDHYVPHAPGAAARPSKGHHTPGRRQHSSPDNSDHGYNQGRPVSNPYLNMKGSKGSMNNPSAISRYPTNESFYQNA